jgi:hypothetical protein
MRVILQRKNTMNKEKNIQVEKKSRIERLNIPICSVSSVDCSFVTAVKLSSSNRSRPSRSIPR